MTRPARFVLSVLLLAGLAGCSLGDDEPAPGSASAAATTGAVASGQPASTGQPSSTASPTPVASLPGLVPGRTLANDEGIRVTYTVVTLRRQGKLALLEVTGRNEDQSRNVNLANPLRGDGLRFDDVTLVDPANAKRYIVARDSTDECLCTSFLGGLVVKPGETGLAGAYFSAPPPGVDQVNVDVPGVGVFPNVPVG